MQDTTVYKIIVLVFALCSTLIGLILLWNKQALENRKNLQQLQAEKQHDLLKASIDGQELERKRIAEDLHDDIGPLLSALNIQLSSLDSQEEQVQEIRTTLNDAVKNLRQVSGKMSPAILEELGLNKAIKAIQRRFRKFSNIELTVTWDNKIEKLFTKKEALSIYRIIQESLTNIIKHSAASKVSIHGTLTEKQVVFITIDDNGKGFDINDEKFGLGLKNMKVRAVSIKGDLHINSTLNKGTIIKLYHKPQKK